MHVLVTGAFGRCGSAIHEHLDDRYSFEYTDLPQALEAADTAAARTATVDVTDPEAVRAACKRADAVVHLAAYSDVESRFGDVIGPNIRGMHVLLEAASVTDVDALVFASSNHVMGGYEEATAPDCYREGGRRLSPTDPPRPDSYYAVSKLFGEHLLQYYSERVGQPAHAYALRIGSLRAPETDHPYADALQGVREGQWDRGSDPYRRAVMRMKALWLSRRDFGHLVDRCLQDESVDYGVFNAVSDNATRWFDISSAKERLGYQPVDDGTAWSEADVPSL